jgi:hypothetical protein
VISAFGIDHGDYVEKAFGTGGVGGLLRRLGGGGKSAGSGAGFQSSMGAPSFMNAGGKTPNPMKQQPSFMGGPSQGVAGHRPVNSGPGAGRTPFGQNRLNGQRAPRQQAAGPTAPRPLAAGMPGSNIPSQSLSTNRSFRSGGFR